MKSYLGWAFASALVVGSIGQVTAADLRLKAPPAPVAVYSWTGCYVGVVAGGAGGRDSSTSNGTNNGVANGTFGVAKALGDISGATIGGTVGCNYQVNRWVFGIEGDYAWSGQDGSSALLAPFNTNFAEDVSNSYIATIRGRVGYAVKPDLMFYGTGGAAFADLKIHEYNPTGAGGNLIGATETHQYTGWTAGAGAEWAFAPNWSAKAEYLYMDFGRRNFFATTATGCCTFQSTRFTDNVGRIGLNYRFNSVGAVVAKY